MFVQLDQPRLSEADPLITTHPHTASFSDAADLKLRDEKRHRSMATLPEVARMNEFE